MVEKGGVHVKREEKKALTRAKVVAAAREIILNEGLDQLSIRKVAKQAQVSPVTMYKYFRDKDELVAEVITESIRERADKALALASDPQLTFVEKLQAFNRQNQRWREELLAAHQQPEAGLTQLWQAAERLPRVQEEADRLANQFWQRMIENGRAEGTITVSASDLAIRYYADALVHFLGNPATKMDPATEADFTDLLLRGLGAKEG